MRRRLGLVLLAALAVSPGLRAAEPPVLRVPGQPDRSVTPASLSGDRARDVRLEDSEGSVVVYHGTPLLEVLEKAGLDVRTMAGERKAAAGVVLATARDGYAVAFSVGELSEARANPKVFLVAEDANGPLPEKEGPVRLVVYGDPVRSAYALARVELKFLADKKP